jgi:CubicO group peptidase (beta-lactamase class C family)
MTRKFVFHGPGDKWNAQSRQALYERGAKTLEELVNCVARLPLKWHPGTRFAYGFSTDVLGRVIEVVTGQRLDQYLKELSFEPLDARPGS